MMPETLAGMIVEAVATTGLVDPLLSGKLPRLLAEKEDAS